MTGLQKRSCAHRTGAGAPPGFLSHAAVVGFSAMADESARRMRLILFITTPYPRPLISLMTSRRAARRVQIVSATP